MHLAAGIRASEPSVKLKQLTISSCAPILGISKISSTKKAQSANKCINFNDKVMSWLKLNESVKLVILSSPFRWINEDYFINRKGQYAFGSTSSILPLLFETMKQIRAIGKDVVIVAMPLDGKRNKGRCLLHADIFNSLNDCDFKHNKNTPAHILFTKLSKTESVYWLHKDICKGANCIVKRDGVYIFNDNAHLSYEGSRYLGKKFNWFNRFRLIAKNPPILVK